MRNAARNLLHLYRDAYAGHPPQIWALAVLTIINRTGTMVLPFLSVYLTTELHFSLADAGILASAFGLGSLAGTYLAGKFIDTYGARLIILISLFVSGFLFLLLQHAETFAAIYGMIFLTAMFGEAYRPAMSKAVGDYVPVKAMGRSMALIRLAINLGMSAAPAIGGFVAASLGYEWLFWIDGITCILGASYFAWTSRNWETREPEVEASPVDKTIDKPKSTTPPVSSYFQFLFASFLMSFCFLQLFHTVPVFIKDAWQFDERYIGSLLAMSSLMVVVIEMPLVHAVEQARRIPLVLMIGLGLIGISFLPFLLPKALIWCVLAVALWTMGEILTLPFNNTFPINMSPPGKRGKYLSWYFMCWSFANVLAPIIGFAIADRAGFDALWMSLAGLMLISSILNYRLLPVMVPR